MKTALKFKTSYDNFEAESDATGLECKDPTLTQQHDEHDANINNIIARYLKTGQLPVHNLPPMQGDFTDAPDYQTALNLMVEAKNAFMEQPAHVRARFHNDPAEYVEFCSDANNADEMRTLGLLDEAAVNRWKAAQAAEKADAEAYRKAQKAPKADT